MMRIIRFDEDDAIISAKKGLGGAIEEGKSSWARDYVLGVEVPTRGEEFEVICQKIAQFNGSMRIIVEESGGGEAGGEESGNEGLDEAVLGVGEVHDARGIRRAERVAAILLPRARKAKN